MEIAEVIQGAISDFSAQPIKMQIVLIAAFAATVVVMYSGYKILKNPFEVDMKYSLIFFTSACLGFSAVFASNPETEQAAWVIAAIGIIVPISMIIWHKVAMRRHGQCDC